ncbi:hypothetical protein SAMN02745171_00001, partial [Porphyromonas circumdentaria]
GFNSIIVRLVPERFSAIYQARLFQFYYSAISTRKVTRKK